MPDARINLDQIRNDPDFQKASPQAKAAGLMRIFSAKDPDFAKATPTQRIAGLQRLFPKEKLDFSGVGSSVAKPALPAAAAGPSVAAKPSEPLPSMLPEQQMLTPGEPSRRLAEISRQPVIGYPLRHPYQTAAAVGAGLGALSPPGAVADIAGAAGLAGPAVTALSAGAGALEQMAYQGLTDLAGKVGGPYASFAASILGPIAGHFAPRIVSPIPAGIQQARTAASEARTTLGDVAETAASKQEAANLEERQSAAQSVVRESERTRHAIKSAMGSQQSKNLTELASAHEKAAQRLQDYSEKLTAHRQAITEAKPGATESARVETATAEAERQRQAMLQRTPEQSAAAISPSPAAEGGVAVPSSEQLQRTAGFRQAYEQPRERIASHYGQQYQDLENRYGGSESPAKPLQEALDKWKDVLREQQPAGQPPSAIQGLMARAGNLIYSSSVPKGIQDIFRPNEIARMPQHVRTSLEKAFANRETLVYEGKGGSWQVLQPEEYMKGDATRPTFIKLRALRTEANRFAMSTSNARDAQIASDIADSADKSLESVEGITQPDLAKLHSLNAQWRDFKSTWTTGVGKEVATTNEPAEAMGKIIKDRKLGRQLAQTATPEEKVHLRQGLADWANDNNKSLAQIGQEVDPAVLKDLGFNLPQEAWLKMEPKQIELSTVLNSSPFAQQQYGQAFDREMSSIIDIQSKQLRHEGIQLARQLGPAGKPFETALTKATTPGEVFSISSRLAGVTPEQVSAGVESTLPTPGSAGLKVARAAPHPARRQFQRTIAAQKTPGEAALQATQDLPTSHEAAIKALQELKPGSREAQYLTRMKGRLYIYGSLAAGEALMTQKIPKGMGALALSDALLSGTLVGRRGASRLIVGHPEIAEMLWQALKEPRTTAGLRATGKIMASLMVRTFEQHAQDQSPP